MVQSKTKQKRGAASAERFFFVAGILLVGIVATAYIHRTLSLRISMRNFEKARHEYLSSVPAGETAPPNATEDVNSGGSNPPSDVQVSRASTIAPHHRAGVPLAILRIPKIDLDVPVFIGTDEITLNRGVGQIPGSAPPGQKGNIGIAGHRDGFFRNLKDLNRGDPIQLEMPASTQTYIVDSILVTGPDDVSVLQPGDEQSLTLVTCYPFRFIGPAPRRFVVKAILK